MKVMFIAYEFPPLNVGGAQRPLKFVQYLPDFNIKLSVITLDPADYSKVYPSPRVDNSLFDGVSEKAGFHFIKTANLLGSRRSAVLTFFSIFFNIYRGAEGKYWRQDFFSQLDRLIKAETYDLIFVTAPPFGVLPLALELAKKHSLPLVVDMRDAWTFWISTPYSNYLNYLLTKRLERRIFSYASKVIVTSKQTLVDFKTIHPQIAEEKFEYIPNGFDGDISFDKVSFVPKGKIRIGYVGNFYYTPEARNSIMTPFWQKRGHRVLQFVPRKEDWLYRSPYFFYAAIKQLLLKYPALYDQLEIRFAGNRPGWLEEMTAGFGLGNIVKFVGFLNHKEIIEFQNECDFLLITSAKVLGGRDYSIAGKTFEYFTLGKPILAFVTEGAQKDLLIEANMGLIFDPDKTDENVEKLKGIFEGGVSLNINMPFINSFQRKLLAEKLSKVLKEAKEVG